MKKLLIIGALLFSALSTVRAAPSLAPTNYLGANYRYIAGTTATTITVAANVDYIMIPRTNLSASLTGDMCSNDVRSLFYFIVARGNAAVDALPTTNTFRKLTVDTGTPIGTVSNLIRRTYQQTFYLDGSGLSPAGE